MSQHSPQELFPNLFAPAKPAKAAASMRPQDMRLLQYCMRQAAKARPAARSGRPSPGAQAARPR